MDRERVARLSNKAQQSGLRVMNFCMARRLGLPMPPHAEWQMQQERVSHGAMQTTWLRVSAHYAACAVGAGIPCRLADPDDDGIPCRLADPDDDGRSDDRFASDLHPLNA